MIERYGSLKGEFAYGIIKMASANAFILKRLDKYKTNSPRYVIRWIITPAI